MVEVNQLLPSCLAEAQVVPAPSEANSSQNRLSVVNEKSGSVFEIVPAPAQPRYYLIPDEIEQGAQSLTGVYVDTQTGISVIAKTSTKGNIQTITEGKHIRQLRHPNIVSVTKLPYQKAI